jgi:hypothetical protein
MQEHSQSRIGTLLILVVGAVPTGRATGAEDAARRAPPMRFTPGPEYADNVRMFQGIPGIERAANGRLWATWYGGGTGEDRYNYIMLVTSGDNGKTWSNLKLVIDPDRDGPCRAFDPCLWHDPQGRLWLSWAQSQGNPCLWAIHTEDSGSENPKWSAPQMIAQGIMMNKPTFLSGGTWLLPVANWGREGSCGVVCSTDGGMTWRKLGQANIPEQSDRQCDEHMIVERKDSSLWMLVRTSYGIGQSVSTDRGKTWSDVEKAGIQHTVSRFFIRRLRSGKLLLVKHNAIDKAGARALLNAFLSDDDGKTWKGGLMIDERNGVSYPDAAESPEGVVYLIYDFHRSSDKQILMAVFTKADVLAGRWVSSVARQRVVVNQATGTRPPVRTGVWTAPPGTAAFASLARGMAKRKTN